MTEEEKVEAGQITPPDSLLQQEGVPEPTISISGPAPEIPAPEIAVSAEAAAPIMEPDAGVGELPPKSPADEAQSASNPTEASESAPAVLDEPQNELPPQIMITKTPDTVTITEVVQPPEVSRVPLDTLNTRGVLKGLWPKLKEKLSFRTEKRLTKIMELARTRATKGESIQCMSLMPPPPAI